MIHEVPLVNFSVVEIVGYGRTTTIEKPGIFFSLCKANLLKILKTWPL